MNTHHTVSAATDTYEVPRGMPLEVWIDKYARRKPDGTYQSWNERIQEVVTGNFSLDPRPLTDERRTADEALTRELARRGLWVLSGRHLQHGDADQATKMGELFTNCFSGSTTVCTLEHGNVAMRDIVGQTVTVRALDGEWRPAKCSHHGRQEVYEYGFAQKFHGKDQYQLRVRATGNHAWYLEDGERVTDLRVGDMIMPTSPTEEMDKTAIAHGLVFGDGCGHRRKPHGAPQGETIAQGATYCGIRLCGADKKYLQYFDDPSYTTYYAENGDPCVYVGRKLWKEVPHTTDPAYVAGFIYGWWLADGCKSRQRDTMAIATTNVAAIAWLKKYASIAGFAITGGTGSEEELNRPERRYFIKGRSGWGKPIYTVRLAKNVSFKVTSQTLMGTTDVYCLEEPVTHGFQLGNGLMTGNCSTALFSWTQFWLLMKGSGCGRSYDSDVHFVNWDYLPNCRFVLSSTHPDYQDWIESLEEARHKYDTESDAVRWFEVEDSAEGWVKILAVMETAAFHRHNTDTTFVFDLSRVRCCGSPITGQQGRPASGPVPLIKALLRVQRLRGLGWKPWKQNLFVDHYMSACVQVGGVRRSARMSTKYWKDKDVIEFIDVKRGGWLYTSNNAILVDAEFWEQACDPRPSHGRRVFEAAVAAAYWDETGEPGFINIDRLTWNAEGMERVTAQTYLGAHTAAAFGSFHPRTMQMIDYVLTKAKAKRYPFLVNPCSEIVKAIYGSYCTVGDVCLANARTKRDALEVVRMAAQALVRTNRMHFLYQTETDRTNRIGVSTIGIFEFMWNVFGITVAEAVLFDPRYYDSLDAPPPVPVAVREWWHFCAEMERAVEQEVHDVCAIFGMTVPHTYMCMKPGGTTPKVMNCTEAANPPAMPYYLRWIQFRDDHPGLQAFRDRGYPVRDISQAETRTDAEGRTRVVNGYASTWIVGFPTKMRVADVMGEHLVTSEDFSLAQYYAWLRLLEQYLMGGAGKGNQISITIKYDPKAVSFQEFSDLLLREQSSVRCAAVMPRTDTSAYIYTPEESITRERYEELMAGIRAADREAIDEASLDCEGGACGIDASRNASIADELAREDAR